MKKFGIYVRNYLILMAPGAVTFMFWLKANYAPSDEVHDLHGGLGVVLLFCFLTWVLALFIFAIMLVVSKSIREQTLRRIANVKERDEREQIVTGKAARTTYISTLSFLILLLVLSIFQVNVVKLDSANPDGKKHTLNVGLKFNLMDSGKEEKNLKGETILQSNDIPLSKTGIVLAIFAWQIIAFSLCARRELQVVD
jgi:hypothetical protein